MRQSAQICYLFLIEDSSSEINDVNDGWIKNCAM